jgi:hypothetical protein
LCGECGAPCQRARTRTAQAVHSQPGGMRWPAGYVLCSRRSSVVQRRQNVVRCVLWFAVRCTLAERLEAAAGSAAGALRPTGRVRGTLRWCCPRRRRRSLCSRSSSVARGKLRTSSSRIHSSHGWLSRVLNMPMKPCTRGDSFAPQRAMSASAHRLRAVRCTTLSLARGRPHEVGLRAQAKARWRHAGHRSAPHLLSLFSRVKP